MGIVLQQLNETRTQNGPASGVDNCSIRFTTAMGLAQLSERWILPTDSGKTPEAQN